MDIKAQNIKLELIKWLASIEDLKVLKKLVEFKKSEAIKETYVLSPEEQESIDKGLKDLEEGRVVPHSEARKVYEKWL